MCGIFAATGKRALFQSYYGLQLLQHRGQDGFGLCARGEQEFYQRLPGLVNQNPIEEEGGAYNVAIGHNRYSTIGTFREQELQPFQSRELAVCHNGNITNYAVLKSQVNYDYQSQNDAEIFLPLLEGMSPENFTVKVMEVLERVEGAYSVVGLLGEDYVFAFKDARGMRPLFYARSGSDYAFASESQALTFLGYHDVKQVKPGEAILVHKSQGIVKQEVLQSKTPASCMFEWIYFAGVEGQMDSLPIYQVRLELGRLLAEKIQEPKKYDIVAPVPDTSRTSAIALSESLGIPYREILIKNRYVQRSFILNTQKQREAAVNWKLMPVISEIQGKNILLVDDSIVRGTTSTRIHRLLKEYGAKSVAIASACPPIRYPCYYGVDFPKKEDLVAHGRDEPEIAARIEADEVFYLEERDLYAAIKPEGLCMACLNGKYPSQVDEEKVLEARL